MWSPKTRKDGGRLEYYENMTKVNEGDIVFSYRKGQLVSVGIIQSRGYSSPKPINLGPAGEAWSEDGWRVDVEYHELASPLRPKDHLESIGPLLPEKYSPIQADGNGNQVYLCSLPKAMGELLVELMGDEAYAIVRGIDQAQIEVQIADQAQQNIEQDDGLQKTEKSQLVKSRRGQGLFRTRLEGVEPACRVTGITNKRHLVASHIKPWSASTNDERLDGENGLLLSPHIDHLFDRGYISFDDDGSVIFAKELKASVIEAWGVELSNVGRFTPGQCVYLKYHRKKVLRQATA